MKQKLTHSEAGKLGAEKSKVIIEKIMQDRIDQYNANPVRCKQCTTALHYKERKKKFCNRSCAAQFNNVAGTDYITWNCAGCNKAHTGPRHKVRKYCNITCQVALKKRLRNIRVEQGTGTRGNAKQYLIEKYGNKCMRCGWNEINPHTGNVPVELEHKDGNYQNNQLSNVELLCPNCHSLTATYKALNKGNGRHSRRERYKNSKSY